MFNQHLLEGIVQVANTDEQGRLMSESQESCQQSHTRLESVTVCTVKERMEVAVQHGRVGHPWRSSGMVSGKLSLQQE